MLFSRKLTVGIIIFLILGTLSCASTETRRSFGQVIDDAAISNKIKLKYLKDKEVNGLKVNVDTWKKVVTLRGRVNSQEQIDRAIEIAERQKGVREVKSYLVIAPPKDKKEKKNRDDKARVYEAGSEEEVFEKDIE